MKSTSAANVGSSLIAAAGVPAWAISRSIRRMAPVAASSAAIGKMTIREPSSLTRSRLMGGVLPPSAQLKSSGTPGKARTAASASASLVSASMNSASAPAWWYIRARWQGRLEPFDGPGVGPGDDHEVGLGAGLHRRADLLDHLLGRDDQLALHVAALLRGHLILDVNPGGPGRLVGAHGADHVQRVAVAGV